MRVVIASCLLLLVGGCSLLRSEVPRTAHDVRVAEASEQGWREAGLPDPGSCLSRLHIIWARDAAELAKLCGDGAMQCLHRTHVVLRPGAEPRDAIHEAMHALYRCTLREVDIYDRRHTDPRVWVDYPRDNPGGAESAQGRARRSYDAR